MRSPARVAGLVAMALVVMTAVFLVIFSDPAGRRAVWYSAGITVAVQAVALSLAHLAAPKHVLKARGVGTILRLLVMVVYGLVLLKPLGLPPTPALISLAALLYTTTVLETWLLTS